MALSNPQSRAPLFAAAFVTVFAINAFAQGATAYLPFVVNSRATVRAEIETVTATGTSTTVWRELSIWPDGEDTLILPLQKVTGIVYSVKRNTNIPVTLRNSGGKITLNLPAQSYGNAEISLYSVNGKRIILRNINAASTVNNITLNNIATGAYLLSVRGADGNALATSRITHSGGSLNIDVTLGSETHSPTPRQAKSTTDKEVWTIKVTADGYEDSTYSLALVSGINPRQTIKLRSANVGVTIGNQIWMAKNLSAIPPVGKSWCSDGSSECSKYGRHYSWEAAREACPAGWHLPTRDEWDKLAETVGGQLITNTNDYGEWHTWLNAGKKLKATNDWKNDRENDSFGFSALPGGRYDVHTAAFSDIRTNGTWWTSTDRNEHMMAYTKQLENQEDKLIESLTSKWMGCSVRCIHD